jgi:hypothetical protein
MELINYIPTLVDCVTLIFNAQASKAMIFGHVTKHKVHSVDFTHVVKDIWQVWNSNILGH